MTDTVPLVCGSDHADKIGKVVVVDVEETSVPDTPERELVAGVLHLVWDEFRDDQLVCTVLVIGPKEVTLDWDNTDVSATIHTTEN